MTTTSDIVGTNFLSKCITYLLENLDKDSGKDFNLNVIISIVV